MPKSSLKGYGIIYQECCSFTSSSRAGLIQSRIRNHAAKLEKQRIDHLLGQAQALHQAAQIRKFVAAIQEANKTAPDPMSADELNSWMQWALAQGDRIDPVINGAYKTRPKEPEE